MSRASVWLRPAAGSSSSRSVGSPASARAISSRFSAPYGIASARAPSYCSSADEGQQRTRPLAARRLGARQGRRAQQRVQQRAAFAQVPPRHHVFEGRHVEEHLQVLERAADAGGGVAMRGPSGQVDAFEADVARVGHVEARQHVEQCRLPGAIRPDDRMDGAPTDHERQRVDRGHAAECLGDTLDHEQRHGDSRTSQRLSVGTTPCGKNTIVAISTAPNTIIS